VVYGTSVGCYFPSRSCGVVDTLRWTIIMVGCHRFSWLVFGLLESAVTELGTPVLLGTDLMIPNSRTQPPSIREAKVL